ncbi:transcription elongation factor A N-terminal and central domain-containing protein 2-like [Watersipora subatra]|uniref:transcription elongation factor A N-terminal and central domain-containing protein 2-like n=1 Tax=Watersipora subatra TaxID=2589382 RepID=UPI00355C4B10
MDKFVIRTPRVKPVRTKVEIPDKEFKQTTILSLRGVVVVEDIQRCKALLEIENQEKNVILEQLKALEKKVPSREVLEETKIGLTLNRLRKHSEPEVSDRATKIYREWKQHFKNKRDKPKIEVRFDHSTNKYRASSRSLLEDRLHPHEESKVLAEAIERSVFHLNGNTGTSYRRHVRSLVFTLRYQPDILSRLLCKKLTVDKLCLLYQKGKMKEARADH